MSVGTWPRSIFSSNGPSNILKDFRYILNSPLTGQLFPYMPNLMIERQEVWCPGCSCRICCMTWRLILTLSPKCLAESLLEL